MLELVVVISIILLLGVAGVRILRDPGPQARKAATDTLSGLIEQARTTAITTRSTIVLAIAEPGDLPVNEGSCFIGLFKVKDWPAGASTLDGVLLRRWQALPVGTVIMPGSVEEIRNPRDEPELTLRYLSGGNVIQGAFHVIAFNPRGSLQWPAGSDPVVLRIAEGSYRNQRPMANARSGAAVIPENRLKIGRVTARPYRFDG